MFDWLLKPPRAGPPKSSDPRQRALQEQQEQNAYHQRAGPHVPVSQTAVARAAAFLRLPHVSGAPMQHQSFLEARGLSQDEIASALYRAGFLKHSTANEGKSSSTKSSSLERPVAAEYDPLLLLPGEIWDEFSAACSRELARLDGSNSGHVSRSKSSGRIVRNSGSSDSPAWAVRVAQAVLAIRAMFSSGSLNSYKDEERGTIVVNQLELLVFEVAKEYEHAYIIDLRDADDLNGCASLSARSEVRSLSPALHGGRLDVSSDDDYDAEDSNYDDNFESAAKSHGQKNPIVGHSEPLSPRKSRQRAAAAATASLQSRLELSSAARFSINDRDAVESFGGLEVEDKKQRRGTDAIRSRPILPRRSTLTIFGRARRKTWTTNTTLPFSVVSECVERFVVAAVLPYIFPTRDSGAAQRERALARKIRRLRRFLTLEHLEIPKHFVSYRKWQEAQALLVGLSSYKSPFDMLSCISRVCKILLSGLQGTLEGGSAYITADVFLPVLILNTVAAAPRHLLSCVNLIQHYRNGKKLQRESGYFFVSFATAVQFVESLEAQHLQGMDEAEYERRMSTQVRDRLRASIDTLMPSTPRRSRSVSAGGVVLSRPLSGAIGVGSYGRQLHSFGPASLVGMPDFDDLGDNSSSEASAFSPSIVSDVEESDIEDGPAHFMKTHLIEAEPVSPSTTGLWPDQLDNRRRRGSATPYIIRQPTYSSGEHLLMSCAVGDLSMCKHLVSKENASPNYLRPMTATDDDIPIDNARAGPIPVLEPGDFPLAVACRYGHTEVATWLLEQAKVDANSVVNSAKQTALHLECRGHLIGHDIFFNLAMVDLLLLHGAEPDSTSAQDVAGRTPLDLARRAGVPPLIELIEHRISQRSDSRNPARTSLRTSESSEIELTSPNSRSTNSSFPERFESSSHSSPTAGEFNNQRQSRRGMMVRHRLDIGETIESIADKFDASRTMTARLNGIPLPDDSPDRLAMFKQPMTELLQKLEIESDSAGHNFPAASVSIQYVLIDVGAQRQGTRSGTASLRDFSVLATNCKANDDDEEDGDDAFDFVSGELLRRRSGMHPHQTKNSGVVGCIAQLFS